MSEPIEKEKYIPTPEELKGESWEYCYTNPIVLPPRQDNEPPNSQ